MFGVNKKTSNVTEVNDDDVGLVHICQTLTAFVQFVQLKTKVERTNKRGFHGN